ncbi:hypothetical protein Taro_019931, partial [Colocasia esculenta]|nr:hypothetical protein [Colocasia esculenta]
TYDLCISTIDNRTHDLYRSTTGSRTHDLCTFTTGSRTDSLCISIIDGEWIYTSSIRPSHYEGEGSYNETMRKVWINEGNKIKPAQASQFITKAIQAHFPGPIHRFSDFSMDVQNLLYDMLMRNHRFIEHSDESRARSAWTTTTRANFKHLLYNVRRNAERVCASTDMNQWKEHRPIWMRKEYWVELCGIWRGEKWIGNSAQAKINRAAHPEANVHTGGSVSFATHKARMETQLKWPLQFQELFDQTHKKKGSNDYISEKSREVAESYTSGAPRKGHVYGLGHSLGTARVISSCSSSVSHATSTFTTPAAPGGSSSAAPTMTPAQFREIVNETVSQNISHIVSQTVSQTLAQVGLLGARAPPTQQPQ